VNSHRLDQLIVEARHSDIGNPDLWVETLAASEILIQAFLFDREYDYWQNAKNPLQYSSHNRPFDHLRLISNGLPPPLEQTIVDTSRNPGRRILRDGYLEAVSSPLWIGNQFWSLVDSHRDDVVKADVWTNVDDLENDVVCFHSHPEPFHDDDAAQKEIQVKIRSALYQVS